MDVISSSWKENTAWGNLTQIILFKQTQKKKKEKKGANLSRYISGEITVGSEFEVAAISCLVVHHVYLSRLAQDKRKKENVLSVCSLAD